MRPATLTVAVSDHLLARTHTALRKAEAYVCSRQSRSGGFCFYRWRGVDEPNLHDTWHAVAALTILGSDVPRTDDIVGSLAGFEPAGVDYIFHCGFILSVLGHTANIPCDWMGSLRALKVHARAEGNVPTSARLETMLRILCLQRCFSDLRVEGNIAEFLDGLCSEGGYGDKPNLRDTWLALGIRHLGGLPSNEATRAFVDGLQLTGFGFVATRDSMLSNLDVIHAGVNACALLDVPLRHPGDIVENILACQTGDGGFARTSDALPDLAYTYRAVHALGRLGAFAMAEVPAIPFEIGL